MYKQSENNQLDEMKLQMSRSSRVRTVGRIQPGSAGGRLPSVESFEVVTSDYNKILEQIGVQLRLPPKMNCELTTMDKCNKYMKYQIRRIHKYKYTNPKLAGSIAYFCIRNSVSFRLSAINHVIPDGYYAKSSREVGKICRKVEQLIYSNSTDVDFRRVFIPKPNGKMRPLGVPTVEGRIVLHMGNNMLIEIMRMSVGASQHGYIPGRGTKTAGQEIIKKSKNYKFIYETDLKGFFDNISIESIMREIVKYKPPKKLGMFIRNLMFNTPKMDEDKKDEITINKEKLFNSTIGKSIINAKSKKEIEAIHQRTEDIYYDRDPTATPEEKETVMGISKLRELSPEKEEELIRGVPQGMPLSPLLSILPLKEEYLNQADHVNYADDQVFFMNEEKTIVDNPEKGIIHNKEKCKGIKYDGKGTIDGLKFLGIRMLEGIDLRSETRSGIREKVKEEFKDIYREEVFDKVMDILEEGEVAPILNEYRTNWSARTSQWLENVAKRNMFGFMLACLNNADGANNNVRINKNKALINLREKVHKHALISKIPSKTHSSSAMFFLHSIVILTMKRNRVKVNPVK